MNIAFGAMAFVVGVRLLWITFIHAVSYPMAALGRRLPESSGPDFLRLARLRAYVYSAAARRVPTCVEPFDDSSWMYKIGTDRWMGHLDALVDRIPARLINHWRRFGIALMGLLVVFWGVVLLAALGLALWTLSALGVYLVEWALAYDWLSLLQVPEPTAPEFDLAEAVALAIEAVPMVAMALGSLVVALIAMILLFWVVMLPFMPGLILHEFGHYAALRKGGASVEGYGLLLIGPALGGAYVQPGADAGRLGREDTLGVWAAGIANSVLWGSALIAVGIVVAGQPLPILEGFFLAGEPVLVNRPLASILLAVGVIEIGNVFVNAVPLGPVDGGGFIRSVEREWWGFHRAIDESVARSIPVSRRSP